jgi:hypothetical protein
VQTEKKKKKKKKKKNKKKKKKKKKGSQTLGSPVYITHRFQLSYSKSGK